MSDASVVDKPKTKVDYQAIKNIQRGAWGSGDYAKIGVTLQLSGEELCEQMDLRAGRSVLDVAAGNGNASLAAARRFARVTSTDYVDSLLEKGRRRAQAEALPIHFQQADAEALPFAENEFDYVLSTFGVMFAPNQQQCASELKRVCKAGGKIGLANWTPAGFIGQLFNIIGSFTPPPAGLQPPSRWGSNEFIQQAFADCQHIAINKKQFVFRYYSAEHWLTVFRDFYGPIHKAFAKLDAPGQLEFEKAILSLIDSMNAADDDSLVLPSEYLEIVIIK